MADCLHIRCEVFPTCQIDPPADPTPPPVPAEALRDALDAFFEELDGDEPLAAGDCWGTSEITAAFNAAAPILLAAGRTAVAEKVRAMSERMQFMTDAAAALVADRDAAYERGRTAAAADLRQRIQRVWPDPMGQWSARQADAGRAVKEAMLRALARESVAAMDLPARDARIRVEARAAAAAEIRAALAEDEADSDVSSGEAIWEQGGYRQGLGTAADIAEGK